MESVKEEISPEQKRRDWLNRIADEFGKIEFFSTEWNRPDEDCPPWVQNVEREVARVAYPGAKLKTSNALTPGMVGAMLGQQCAYAVWMQDCMVPVVAPGRDSPEEVSPTEDEVLKAQTFCEEFFDWFSGLRRLAKRALCSSVDQSYEDMSEFLLAYAVGFAKKPKGQKPGDIGSTTIEIYIFLLVNWRLVARLQSVSALHAVLRQFIGEYKTGDLKRVEKIYQRIDLHFGKPGRPKKRQ